MTSSPDPLAAFGAPGQLLARTLASGRLSPSYLFEGMDAAALHEAARAFAAGILAGDPPDPRARKLALAGTHPDLHELTKDKATVISVAALTPVLERAHSTPLEARHQVFLVDPADAMDPAGIARYLKSLEEPAASTVFILVTTRAERLPDTVLSRCRRVRFPPLAPEAMIARLIQDDVPRAAAQSAVRAASGSLSRARRLAAHDVCGWAREIITAALDAQPGVARAVESILSRLEAAAAECAADIDASTKRQQVRVLLSDVLHVLSIEARDAAAGRASALPADWDPDAALDLLTSWGRLDAAVAANVTPAAVLIEAVGVLRRPYVRHLSG
ncbi:MAG: hypothetical protein O2894_07130 [Planctomycetota bacterium]|nr:hypothetical protein [Planctomycetota bacterium]